MATADDVTNELLGTNPPAGHHDLVVFKNMPMQTTIRTVQSKATFAADEVTKGLPERDLGDLKSRRGKSDTTLGHAINAASYGDKIWQALEVIAAKVGADISGIK